MIQIELPKKHTRGALHQDENQYDSGHPNRSTGMLEISPIHAQANSVGISCLQLHERYSGLNDVYHVTVSSRFAFIRSLRFFTSFLETPIFVQKSG